MVCLDSSTRSARHCNRTLAEDTRAGRAHVFRRPRVCSPPARSGRPVASSVLYATTLTLPRRRRRGFGDHRHRHLARLARRPVTSTAGDLGRAQQAQASMRLRAEPPPWRALQRGRRLFCLDRGCSLGGHWAWRISWRQAPETGTLLRGGRGCAFFAGAGRTAGTAFLRPVSDAAVPGRPRLHDRLLRHRCRLHTSGLAGAAFFGVGAAFRRRLLHGALAAGFAGRLGGLLRGFLRCHVQVFLSVPLDGKRAVIPCRGDSSSRAPTSRVIDRRPCDRPTPHRAAARLQTLDQPCGTRCRFVPSCSGIRDGRAAGGALKGGWLAARRIGRCHPLHPAGARPRPLNRKRHGLHAHRQCPPGQRRPRVQRRPASSTGRIDQSRWRRLCARGRDCRRCRRPPPVAQDDRRPGALPRTGHGNTKPTSPANPPPRSPGGLTQLHGHAQRKPPTLDAAALEDKVPRAAELPNLALHGHQQRQPGRVIRADRPAGDPGPQRCSWAPPPAAHAGRRPGHPGRGVPQKRRRRSSPIAKTRR